MSRYDTLVAMLPTYSLSLSLLHVITFLRFFFFQAVLEEEGSRVSGQSGEDEIRGEEVQHWFHRLHGLCSSLARFSSVSVLQPAERASSRSTH